ncbi:hypothetical protein QL285_000235 [Trifolium repens]|jgi:hypothetical protein|nr:hypothetical protein QL285_000235 [Trifolium repens]
MPCRLLQNLGFGGKTLLLSIGLGNGNNTVFWRFKWYGDQPLCALFSELLAKETSKEALIVERLQGNGSNHNWTWQWLQQLSVSEIQQVAALEELFSTVCHYGRTNLIGGSENLVLRDCFQSDPVTRYCLILDRSKR